MTQIIETEQTERSKVQSWRLHVLIEAGYPLSLAGKLAEWYNPHIPFYVGAGAVVISIVVLFSGRTFLLAAEAAVAHETPDQQADLDLAIASVMDEP